MQFRLTNSQRYLVVWLVGLGFRLLLSSGLVGLVLWLVLGLALTKYHCEFVNLNCIFAMHGKFAPCHFATAVVASND